MALKVFLSFSGNQSKLVASHLRTLIKMTCAAADPWMSDQDLRLGGPWHYEILKQLQTTHFGIICLDRSNMRASWLHFEAGAIAKTLDESAVFPYLVGIAPADLSGPLQHFQSARADKEGTRSLITALNHVLKEKNEPFQSETNLAMLFELCWPEFERALHEAPKAPQDAGPERSNTEILAELLSTARMHSRLLASMVRGGSQHLPPIERAAGQGHSGTSLDLKRLEFEDVRRAALDLRSAGRHVEAIEAFRRALELAPDDLETCIDIAVTETYIDAAHYERSIQRLSDIVRPSGVEPTESGHRESIIAKAYYNLACIKVMAREERAATYETTEILADLEAALLRYPLYLNTARQDQDLVPLRQLPEFRELMTRHQLAQR
jgi:tetratricopeptide (TPR) repeat protein